MPAAVALLMVALGAGGEGPQPWYARPSCIRIEDMIMAAEFQPADSKIGELEKSSDVEDRACAAWLRVALSEAQISFAGRIPATLKNRDDALLRMFRFGKTHRNYAPHISDMAMEARMRRVRGLVERGDRTAALREAKTVKEWLKTRLRKGPETPSVVYVQAVSNMAVSQSGWALRTLLNMAGLSGDADEGRKALRSLMASKSVYAYDAHYVLYHFARENPDPANGNPLEYSETLNKKFPNNPQFVYDYAKDLWKNRRCKDSMQVMSPLRGRMENAASGYSATVRAKLFYMTGRCALELGDKNTAIKYTELAAAEGVEDLDEEIRELKDDLSL